MTKLLTIGNSFAVDALSLLPSLLEGGGEALFIGRMNLGGCSLEKHWNLVEQCRMLPEVKPYELARTGMEPVPASLEDALGAQDWDYVTLQQVSDLSFRPETYQPYLDSLVALIARLAPRARVVLHQTWAYRCDAPELLRYELGQAQMHERLTAAYGQAAQRLGCRQLPSGRAFALAREALGYVPDASFDVQTARPLELPDQTGSLIVGYFWRTGNTASGKAELAMDGRHGNVLGRYLAGAVWYEMFTGKPIAQNPFVPGGIEPDTLHILREAAHHAVLDFGGPLKEE